ncbi:DUF2397 domain-containing protein [Kribbella sp. NPDC059898]|uniref:DUF2397 domain-containing protein n=1 Tax=Kribbella sp. NPDC059898 TaxID=3346995 RepID=UPI0036529195
MLDGDGGIENELDVWYLADLPGRETVPTYLVTTYAAQYRVIVEVLLAEQDNSLTGLSYDEIAAAVESYLSATLSAEVVAQLLNSESWHLDNRLEQLGDWQVVTRWQEPARSGEDFLRRRDKYQLTQEAARLHAFWTAPGRKEDIGDGELTLAPHAIADRLTAFGAAIGNRDYLGAAGEFQQITALHGAMATAARRWQRGLAHALSGGPDEAKQDVLLRTLQAYVATWGEQVDVNSPRIADLIAELDIERPVWRACVRASLSDDAPEDLVEAQLERWLHTWSALAAWFVGPTAQARRLRRQLRDLVAPWARNMHILMDSAGAVTRRPELLRLAAAIEQAPSDEDAWRIWDTALGLFSTRHLLLPAEAPEDSALGWAQAPAAPVTARFRRQGARSAVGRRARTPDYSEGRAAARRSRVAALAERRSAEAALRQRTGTTIASWGYLEAAEFELFLELVGTARRTGETTSGARSAVTADGRWRVQLAGPVPVESSAVIQTPDGSLVTPNWLFEMTPA